MQVDALIERLRTAARPEGGWGYYPDKTSRIEPTCWALLALPDVDPGSHVAFLRSIERDGLLIDPASPSANFGWNGLALLTLQAVASDESSALATSLRSALVAAKGVQLRPQPTIRQDPRLQAWSWTDGTFSWVEPTTYCLLALKQLGGADPEAAARIEEAEAVLADRVCVEGGWNYGNAVVLGQELRPYVPTTALGLLAMQDRRDLTEVQRSLGWLEEQALSEASGMALSLAAVALRVFGRPIDEVTDRLLGLYDRSGFLDNAHVMAMALYALTIGRHGAARFRLGRS